MTRLEKAFANGKALIAYLVGGDPGMEESEEFLLSSLEAGAAMAIIGIPFSDPAGEDRLLQEANVRALAAGATTEELLSLVSRLRSQTGKALLFRSYLNPVFRHGYEAFFRDCKDAGLDGIMIADLPFEERDEVLVQAEAEGIELITLTAPAPADRLETLARNARGFIYHQMPPGRPDEDLIDLIRKTATLPVVLGSGSGGPDRIKALSSLADGVVIESALVDLVGRFASRAGQPIRQLISISRELLQA